MSVAKSESRRDRCPPAARAAAAGSSCAAGSLCARAPAADAAPRRDEPARPPGAGDCLIGARRRGPRARAAQQAPASHLQPRCNWPAGAPRRGLAARTWCHAPGAAANRARGAPDAPLDAAQGAAPERRNALYVGPERCRGKTPAVSH